MNRNHKDVYLFISDESGRFHSANQLPNGDYVITKNARPVPLKNNPPNLVNTEMEFGTNNKYFSLNRTITYPLQFIKDGGAILRNLYYNGKGIPENTYLTVIQWNGIRNVYELAYKGKIDYATKSENPKSGMFTVSSVDDSAWGVLSQNDDVVYSIDCSPTNPKAVRVLLDGITLKNKYTFQTVQAPISSLYSAYMSLMPLVLINEDGDSSGIIAKSQTLEAVNLVDDYTKLKSHFFISLYPIGSINIQGSISFIVDKNEGGSTPPSFAIYLYTSNKTRYMLYQNYATDNINKITYGKKTSFDFNLDINLGVSEGIFLVIEMAGFNGLVFTLTPVVTNIVVTTLTTPQPEIAYGLRAIDLLKELVAKGTNNRYTIDSQFFSEINNRDIALSGESLRGIPNAHIYSSFADFFATFDALYFMALRVVNGALEMETAIDIYDSGTQIIDLGEAIDVILRPELAYVFNEVEVGAPKQDFRRPSGRLEFNSTNSFSLPIFNVNKKLNIVTKYRTGCYDIQFMLMDYKGQSTQDNNGDKSVYLVKITDELASALEDVQTFENITVDNALLQPIIKSPLTNDILAYKNPVIRGIAPPLSPVNIYVDNVLDGGTDADANGNWSYVIQTALEPFIVDLQSGAHTIDATFTDNAAPKSTVTIVIDEGALPDVQILYPGNGDSLYNNKPLIKGVAPAGTVVQLFLDEVLIATVTSDESGKWEHKAAVIPNGNHVIRANTDTARIYVDSFVSSPLITYVGSELDGFVIQNNLPLVQGVAIPGTVVQLWINYIPYSNLGTAIADANGNWSIQVQNTSYADPSSGISIVIAPIRNGLSVMSTLLVNQTVSINNTGYKLERPDFSLITGVIDNTVFNTAYTPKRMMGSRNPLWASIFKKQPNEKIYFQTSDKNGNLVTVEGPNDFINEYRVAENEDIPASSLGRPLMLLEQVSVRVKALKSFAKTLYDFNQGGVVKCTYRGQDLYMLPIGSMKIAHVKSDIQEWKLVMSPLTEYSALLNLYKNGLTINLMKNTIYRSEYNPLHFVKYDFTKVPNINNLELYEDYFSERSKAWNGYSDYTQKFQTNDTIKDQIITNGISNISLKVYRCADAVVIDTIAYAPVIPAPINPPDVVLEASINWGDYPAGRYFIVKTVGAINVAISERIETRESWPNTIWIDAGNSLNKTGVFFSTGFRTKVRVEGLVKKLQPDYGNIVATEEAGNSQLIYSTFAKQRVIRFGTAYGLPDFLYLKVAAALGLDDLKIENVGYTPADGETINPSEDINGHPLYYYNVNMLLKDNAAGFVFEGADDSDVTGVILMVDAEAFGIPTESLIDIEIKNE